MGPLWLMRAGRRLGVVFGGEDGLIASILSRAHQVGGRGAVVMWSWWSLC
jgi:hypothetical protein